MIFILSLAVLVYALWVWRRRAVRRPGDAEEAADRRSGWALPVALLAGLAALSQALTVIPAGSVGVVDFYGNVSETALGSGIHLVNPLAKVVRYSTKTTEIKETLDVPSKEGLTIKLEISLLYHLNPRLAPIVYRQVQENYAEVVIMPNFRSVVRGVTASVDAKALYTSQRESLEQVIQQELKRIVEPRGIVVEKTPLRNVSLPAGLTQAIEEKLRAEQESQRMQFVLQKERQEAERKRIEAQGISDFQNIVTKGISEPLLQWKGIEATEKLAGSQNAKIVVIGAGKNGLPLILNQ